MQWLTSTPSYNKLAMRQVEPLFSGLRIRMGLGCGGRGDMQNSEIQAALMWLASIFADSGLHGEKGLEWPPLFRLCEA